jgi:outer membrane receptor protein involved in Fe transport
MLKRILCLLFVIAIAFAGVTGKIMGTITDEKTGEALPGANIMIEGTSIGAATNAEGFYVIMNVAPGTYNVIARYIGYETVTMKDVEVKIDLTKRLDYKMQADVIGLEGVVVEAEQKVVEVDVTGSMANISKDEIEALPATTIGEVVALKVGVTSAYGIRGSGSDEVSFMVDGVIQRDARTNEPTSVVPLSAVQALSVQTGGMGAEYNNVRSGVVNVVMRDGDPDKYEFVINLKGSPPASKSFNVSPYDPESFWLKPYMDEDVAWDGTNGESYIDANRNGQWDRGESYTDVNNNGVYDASPWASYTQEQYVSFNGWKSKSQSLLNNTNPNDDLTAGAAQRVFLYEHRRHGIIDNWDYNIDAGFGGPVPFVSKALGNLRFFASYREDNTQYIVPMCTDGITDRTGMLKITSNLASNQKLSFIGMMHYKNGTSSSRSGYAGMMSSVSGPASAVTDLNVFDTRVFSDAYYSISSEYDNTYSLKYTNLLNDNSTLDVIGQIQTKRYETGPMPYRDTSLVYEVVPGYTYDDSPFGWHEDLSLVGINGMMMGGAFGTGRDSSSITTYRIRADYGNQINENNQIKAGLEFQYDHLKMNFGSWTILPSGQYWTEYEQQPYRFIFYAQDKLEYEGLVANLGVTGQYINANGDWYNVTEYDAFFGSPSAEVEMIKIKPQLYVSPRIGISHPISETSKLFFNYGQYVQLPAAESMYRVQRYATGKVITMGNPTLPLANTTSYEIGFDQAVFDDYLLRISGYYKDIVDQEDRTYYQSVDGGADYGLLTANSYEDIRGAELELSKVYGEWFTGNINLEYRVQSWGQFGLQNYYQDVTIQREYERNEPNYGQALPVPRVKAYLDLHTPKKFGPKTGGLYLLGGWHCSLIGGWTQGGWITWNPTSKRENGIKITNNIRWKDSYYADMKFNKDFRFDRFTLSFYLDIFNVINKKSLYTGSVFSSTDSDSYYYSLHYPQEIIDEIDDYGNIPGNDKPGEFRDIDVEYVPMEHVWDIATAGIGEEGVIYYNAADGDYYRFDLGVYVPEDDARVQEVLDSKAYIDMPNFSSFNFLNPRDIFFGINLSFDLNK